MAAPRVAFALDTSRLKRAPVSAVVVSDQRLEPRETRELITAVGPEGVALVNPVASATRLVIPLPGYPPPGVPPPPLDDPVPHTDGSLPARPLTDKELTALAAQSLIEDARAGGSADAVARGPKLVIPAVGGDPATLPPPAAAPGPGLPATAGRSGGGGSGVDAGLRERLFRPDQQRIRGSAGTAPMLARQMQAQAQAASDAAGADVHATAAAADGDRERLAADLSWRAADVDARGDAYDAVPISEFGAAMLRGMGVTEAVLSAETAGDGGGGGGRARPQGLGLGAQLAPQLEADGRKQRGPVRPGDPLPAQGGAAAGGGAASRKFPGVVSGAVVQVMKGRFTAKVGVVTAAEGVPGLDMCRVRVVAVGRASFAAAAAADPAAAAAAAATAPAVCAADTEITVVPKRDCRPVSAAELAAGAAGGLGEQAAHVALLTAAENAQRAAERAAERARAALVSKEREAAERPPEELRGRRDEGPGERGGRRGMGAEGRGDRDDERDRGADSDGRRRHRDGDYEDSGARRRRSRSRSGEGERDRDRRRAGERSGGDRGGATGSHGERGSGREADRRHHHHHHRDDDGYPRRGSSRSRSRDGARGGGSRRDAAASSSSSSFSNAAAAAAAPPPWLAPGIRVRLTDGRLAGREGVVVDVPRPCVCALHVEGSSSAGAESIEGVPQRVLAPVPPAVGRACLVLRGPHRLRRGVLVEGGAGGGSWHVRLLDDEDEEVVRVAAGDVAALSHGHS